MSKYASMPGLTDLVVELRDAGTPWDAEGGIVTQVQAAYPSYTTKSAIPLRKLYHAAKAEPVKATKARVIAARKIGAGWSRIAVNLGVTESEAKALVAGTEWAEGRVYVDGAGNAKIVDLSAKEEDASAE